jgi:mannose-6-phosphate isomerase-like protein (cupin superfamily)
LLPSSTEAACFIQRFTPERANLLFLSCGEYRLPPSTRTQTHCLPREEALLFMWRGQATVTVEGVELILAPYDVLYIPRGAEFSIATTPANRHV